jgi:hypothetical protein
MSEHQIVKLSNKPEFIETIAGINGRVYAIQNDGISIHILMTIA